MSQWRILATAWGTGSDFLSTWQAWRADPQRMRVFRRASWLWVGMFSARLVVQLPLYLAGAVVALGIARTALGVPVFALCLWLSWLLVRSVRQPAAPPAAQA